MYKVYNFCLKISRLVRVYLLTGFVDVETPTLFRKTPGVIIFYTNTSKQMNTNAPRHVKTCLQSVRQG